MGDSDTPKRKDREDQTSELKLGELVEVGGVGDDDPSTEELEPIEMAALEAASPPPPPASKKSVAPPPPKPGREASAKKSVAPPPPQGAKKAGAKKSVAPPPPEGAKKASAAKSVAPPPPKGASRASAAKSIAPPPPKGAKKASAAKSVAPPPPTPGGLASAKMTGPPPPPSKSDKPKASAPPPAPKKKSMPPPAPRGPIPKKEAVAEEASAAKPPAKKASRPKRAAMRPPSEAPPPPTEAPETDASAEELRDLCLEQLQASKDPARTAQLAYELGRLHEVELRDPAKAAEHYQEAHRAEPNHAAAIRGARRALWELGRHAALPPLYDAEIAITRDPPQRARLLYAKARVHEEHLRNAPQALVVYREALALDPGNVAVLKAVERAQRRDKAFEPLAETYGELANAVQDPALKAAWTSQRAYLTESKLNDPVQAAMLYEQALETDPHSTGALANVKRLGATHGRWSQVVAALLREHELVGDATAKRDILATVARIQERGLRDLDAAVSTLDAALVVQEDSVLLQELARLHRQSGKTKLEVDALSRLVEVTDDGGERAAMAHRLGQLHEQRLDDVDRALAWYERCLRDDPTHREAAAALARIHRRRGRWQELIQVLERRSEGSKSARARAELHHQIGTLQEEHLEQPDAAADQHAKALTLDPDHRGALSALSRLYAQAERWHELAELYERSIDRAAHDAEAIAWLFRLGGILEDRVGDPDGALAAYRRILERAPDDLGALHAAQRAAELAGAHADLIGLLQAEAKLEEKPERVADLLYRAAMATLHGLEDPEEAMKMLEALLRRRAQHRRSLEALAQLLSAAGRWAELVMVYRRLIPLTSTEDEKVRLHYQIGDILETQLGQPAEALGAYEHALRLDRGFLPARDAMRSALERAEKWDELAKLLEGRLSSLSGTEKARAATELGQLFEERLQDEDRALAAYETAVEAVSMHRPALDARERLLTDKGDWGRLQEVLHEEAEGSSDPFARSQAALRAAFIRSEQQGAVAPALEAFRPVFDAQPDHVGGLLAVEEIYARTRDDAGLAVTFEKLARVLDDPKAKLAALRELVRAKKALGEDEAPTLRQILALVPDDHDALEALATASDAAGDTASGLAMHARLAATASDPGVQAFHQTRVGELLLQAEDLEGALGAFRAALGLDPRSIAATRGLSRAAQAAEDPEALRQAARHEAQVTRDTEVAVGLLLSAALLRRNAGELNEAATDYERALTLDPDSEDAAHGLRGMLVQTDEVERLAELLTRAAHEAKKPSRRAALHLLAAQLHADVRGDVGAATAAAERALTARADHPSGLARLAEYLERGGHYKRAVETLDRLIPKAKGDVLVEAHLRLAAMAEDHLRDRPRAIRSLRAALTRDEDNIEALQGLVRLERLEGRDEEALRLVRHLIEVVDDDVQRADAHGELAEIESVRGDHEAAAEAALGAVEVAGPASSASDVYKRLVQSAPKHASWDAYADALLRHLERARTTGAPVGPVYRELASVFSGANVRPDRAIATLREGVEACPDDVSISLALSAALKELDTHGKALGELRRLVSVRVDAPEAWRAMANLFRDTGEPDGAAVAFAPLVVLGVATDAERRQVEARKPRVAEAPPGILGEGGLKQLTELGALDSTATPLVHALSDVFTKLEGFEPEEWGLTKRDRVRSGDPHAVRAFADRLAPIFGVPEYDLYVTGEHGLDRAVVLPGSPPVILVGTPIETASDPVLAFHLARCFALLSRFLHPVDLLPDDDVARMLVAAARYFDHVVDAPGIDAAELDEEQARVGGAIGFFARGRVQEAAASFASNPPPDLFAWVADVRRMAYRAALLVVDDLGVALEAHGAKLGEDPVADDLACFWAADPAMRYRRAVAQHL